MSFIFQSERWRRVRKFVIHRDDGKCQHCGVFVGYTPAAEVDHIVPRSHCEEIGIDPFDPENLQTLCKSCHSKKTWRDNPQPLPKKVSPLLDLDWLDEIMYQNDI